MNQVRLQELLCKLTGAPGHFEGINTEERLELDKLVQQLILENELKSRAIPLTDEARDYLIACVQIDKEQMETDHENGHVTEAELAENLAWADEVLKILGLECDCENLPYPNCPKCIEHMKAVTEAAKASEAAK